ASTARGGGQHPSGQVRVSLDRAREVSRDLLSRSRRRDRIVGMGAFAEANRGALLRREVGSARVESETELVPDLSQRSVDPCRDRKMDGGTNQSKSDYDVANESRFHGNSSR